MISNISDNHTGQARLGRLLRIPLWYPYDQPIPTLGTMIGQWRVIGSKPGAILLILKRSDFEKTSKTEKQNHEND